MSNGSLLKRPPLPRPPPARSCDVPPTFRYRDIKDKVRYEGPFDFHEEDELPELLVKLTEIEADGGG